MIKYIQVTIEPWQQDEYHKNLRVKIKRDGEPDIGYDKLAQEPEFESYFDQMWNHIGKVIKEKAIKCDPNAKDRNK